MMISISGNAMPDKTITLQEQEQMIAYLQRVNRLAYSEAGELYTCLSSEFLKMLYLVVIEEGRC